MDQRKTATRSEPPLPRTWDARLARSLVRPLVDTPVTPNHLTTVRLLIGLAGAWCLAHGGFETEDVLYLLPLVTLFDGVEPFLLAASIGAPLFAAWVVIDWWRIVRRGNVAQNPTEIQASK